MADHRWAELATAVSAVAGMQAAAVVLEGEPGLAACSGGDPDEVLAVLGLVPATAPGAATDLGDGAPGRLRWAVRVPLGTVPGALHLLGPSPPAGGAAPLAVRAIADAYVAGHLLDAAGAREAELRADLAEGAAAKSFLDTLLDTVEVGIVTCDADCRLTSFNRAARELHDLDADPAVHVDMWASTYALYDADATRMLTPGEIPLRRALRERLTGVVMTVRAPGRPVRYLRVDGQPLRTPDGAVSGAVVAMHDVTAETVAARREAEASTRLHSAFDAMPQAVWLLAVQRDAGDRPVDLTVEWGNRAALAFGPDPARGVQLGQRLGDVFPEMTRELGIAFLDVARDATVLRRPAIWLPGVSDSLFNLTVVPRGPDGLLLHLDDVTAQRRSELAQIASEARLRQAQRLAGIATWSWDLVTGTVEWSPLLRQLFDLPEDAVASLDAMLDRVHPDDRDAFTAAYTDLLATRADTTLDHRLSHDEGVAPTWVRAWASVELDHRGEVVRMFGSKQDITAERAREDRLAAEAQIDQLTGIANRRGWELRAPELAAEAHRRGQPVAVAMLDLDHFKTVNDSQGHAAGDELLRRCCRSWQQQLRRGDLLARVGGEEFALLLTDCQPGDALVLVERMRARCPAGVTASVGLTALSPTDGLDEGLDRADRALYLAKRSGRDRAAQL